MDDAVKMVGRTVHTMNELRVHDIKRILRECDIDPRDILAAQTKVQLVDPARKRERSLHIF